MLRRILSLKHILASAMLLVFAAGVASAQNDAPVLARFLPILEAGALAPGADGFGPIRNDLPIAPILRGGDVVGHVFVTSDFVGTTGYSGKPIHTAVAVDNDARVLGVELAEHSEPIVLIGIPDREIRELVAGYRGMDLAAEAAAGGSAHELEIISGATVTIMVIDDSIVRSGIKVARALGLGGLAPEIVTGPTHVLAEDAVAPGSLDRDGGRRDRAAAFAGRGPGERGLRGGGRSARRRPPAD
jgi:NosR/NirI family nitrous oxide reductase transcriptional regulator